MRRRRLSCAFCFGRAEPISDAPKKAAPDFPRLPAAGRAAVMKNLTRTGLTYQDAANAKLQHAALQHAINTGATRAGQVAFLSNEIPGQPSAVTFVAGNWLMQGGSVASVSSTGVISGADASTGCTISGHVSVSNTRVNLYNVSVT
jgi:hypothetical protein